MRKTSTFFSGLVLIILLIGFQNTYSQNHPYAHNIVDTIITDDGQIIVGIKVPGIPPKDYKAPIAYPTDASVTLPNVPAFNWSFGCSATSAAMIAGHYDNMGYPNMYDGPTNGGSMPMDNSSWPDVYLGGEWRHQCPLSATRDGVDGRTIFGHVDDYWVSYGSTAPDPYIGNWTQHTYGQCTGDYMKTNQSAFGNDDASTTFYYWNNGSAFTPTNAEDENVDHLDGMYGFKLFCESRGYTVTSTYSQYIEEEGLASGFTYDQFKAEIDAGRPVLIHVTDHTMVGYGYDDASNLVYIHDTWDYSDHSMTWAGSYSGLQHYGVTVLRLSASTINVWTGNLNSYWGNGTNWSLGHVPTATENVEIPNLNMPCIVDYSDKVCNNLRLYAGAQLEIWDQVLTVNGNLTVEGNIEMTQANAYLNVYQDISWEAGSGLDVLDNSTYIQVWGDWNFKSGANINPTQGFVDFEGTATSYIRCYDDNSSFYRLRAYKTGGGIVGFSGASTENLVINGLMFIASGAVFNSYDEHDIYLRGNLNYYGSFDFDYTGCVVYFDGASQGIHKYSTNDGVFNHVVFSASTGVSVTNGPLTAMGNITINQGYFDPGAGPVSVGGNWYNYLGTSGFAEGTSRVIFNGGNYHQYCSNETFNELEVNKPLGGALRMNGTNVVCAAYDWTAGAVDVLTGSFTANDLLDNAVAGAFYTNTGGTINLINSGTGTYIDLKGELYNYGGDINITGSLCYWPYATGCIIEMTGGTIDVSTTSGILIYNSATYTLTENITGGTIRTNGYFRGERADFQPTGSTIELYGTSDKYITQLNGCGINNLIINKSADDGLKSKPYPTYTNERDEIIYNGSKDNNIDLNSNVTVGGNITVESGELTLAGYELTVPGNCYVYGVLNMDNPADVLNVGTTYSNRLWFYSGSTGNFSEGVANIYGWFQPLAGCSVTGGLNHTVVFKGIEGGGPNNFEPTATYGNIEIFKNPGQRTFVSAQATQPIVINGNLIVHPNNEFEMQDKTVIVHGNVTDNSSSEIYVYTADKENSKIFIGPNPKDLTFGAEYIESSDESGSKGGYFEIDTDFLLTGLLDVGDGDVLIHGNFDEAASGSLIINGGSLISDAPTASISYYAGTFDMADGLLEITNNPMNFYPSSSTIGGGTIRCGGSFISNQSGTIQPTGGSVELIGAGSTGQYIQLHADNYFHNLTINRTNTIQIYTGHDLDVRNNFIILSGGLHTNSLDMYVGGDWENTVGPAAFVEGTGKVVFNGSSPEMQYINSSETFNIIENNTVEAIRINSALHTVTCNSYDWTSGGVSVLGGTFIANDLADIGLYGSFWGLTNSEIHLYQDTGFGQYVDLFGTLHVHGNGLIKIYGGADNSFWANGSSVTINSGGTIDFTDWGVRILSGGTFTETITDGTLRMAGYFDCERNDFNPTGGNIEFYGGSDAMIDVAAGSTLHNVLINKSGGDKSIYQYKDRDGNVIESTKSNMAYLSNNLEIEGELIVDEGILSLNANTLNCYGDININDGGILNVNDNSTLALDNAYLHANSGGILEMLGSAGNEATITMVASTMYGLWIENGGTISAEHALFEYMTYVYLMVGSSVDPVHSFHNCTFQNGGAGGNLIVKYNNQNFQVNNAVFPTNTWGGLYNIKNTTPGDITFYNASGGFAGPEYENDDYNTIHWTTDTYQVDLEVFLEGPFNSSTTKMDYTLYDAGLIPTSQPFNTNPLADWYYLGSESVGSVPDFVVDWVLVELRDAPNIASALPARVIATQAGFVLNNGEVVGLDGLNPLSFNAGIFNNLYVNVWHRNHLGVISANPLVNIGGTYSYNFHSGSGQAYGGTSAQVQLDPGIWGILSGDANGNGFVGQPDKVNIWNIQTGESGYKASDFNLDGQVNNLDKNDYFVPNFGSDSFIPE